MKLYLSNIKFKNFFPSFIFSLCIIEQVTANFFPLFTVRFFQIYLVYFFFKRLNKLTNLKIKDKGFVIYLLFILFYLIALLRTQYLYETILGELANLFFWTTFGFLLSFENRNDNLFFQKFIYYTSCILFISFFFIFYFSYSKGIDLYNGNILDNYVMKDGSIIEGTSLNSDYNVYSLAVCIMLIFSFHIIWIHKLKILKLIYLFTIISSGFLVFFSGSRRGFIFYFLTLFILLLYYNKLIEKKYSPQLILTYIFLFIGTFIVFSNFETITSYLEGFDGNMFSGLRTLTLNDQISQTNERTIRWNFFMNLFDNYNLFEIFFGQNFDYLNDFQREFNEIEDNPHNFILSTILYGGLFSLLGLLLLIFIVCKGLLNSKNYIFLIVFFLYIIFGFTSSNTLFSSKIPPIIITYALLNANFIFDNFSKKSLAENNNK